MKYLITNPLNYFFAILLVALATQFFFKARGYWRAALWCLTLLTFLVLTPYGANLLVSAISITDESQNCDTGLAVLLPEPPLGRASHSNDFSVMTQSTFARSHAAVEHINNSETNVVAVLGEEFHENEPLAGLITYNYLIKLGVESNRIIFRKSTQSPADNAHDLSEIVPKQALIIFTSDIEARRTKLAFERQGFSVCIKTIENNQLIGHPVRQIIPSGQPIVNSEKVLWETVGILWYWWTDRI